MKFTAVSESLSYQSNVLFQRKINWIKDITYILKIRLLETWSCNIKDVVLELPVEL